MHGETREATVADRYDVEITRGHRVNCESKD